MPRAIVMRSSGGPEVLQVQDVEVGKPGPGQARLRQTAVGVNFHDIYVRTGLYKTLPLPGIPGLEAVGVVDAVGPDVRQVQIGDRVGLLTTAYGGYAEVRLADADQLVKLPASVDDGTAAATLLRGLTALMLVQYVHKIEPGQTVLVHAASGGVGRLVCQWARHLGATVIGTAGSEEKAKSARENGCDHVILYRTENFVDRVQAITGGRGVDAAYDAVGKDTFMGSMACLARRGHLVNFGQASGPVDPVPMTLLFQKSNSVTRPNLFHYIDARARRERMAAALFEALARGIVTPGRIHEYSFEDAGRAQGEMEGRRTAGAVILRT
ncbi:MAG TPA: quinone oxidoreductase [Burkholderiales bacterium]|nr:quinone oxidoreductase [Burkholderiales bacterium]